MKEIIRLFTIELLIIFIHIQKSNYLQYDENIFYLLKKNENEKSQVKTNNKNY